MSWHFHHSVDEQEESFWPSFTDIMMVIVMVFLLVTVAVILTNARLLDDLRSSLQAEEKASELAEVRLRENATLEEQLDYFRQRATDMEMALLRSKASRNDLMQDLDTARAHITRLKQSNTTQQQTITQLTAGREALQLSLDTTTKQLQQQQADVAGLNTQLQDEQQKLDGLQQQLQQAQAREASLNQQLSAAQAEQDTLGQQLVTAQQSAASLTRELEVLQAAQAGTKTQLDDKAQRISTLELQLERVSSEARSLRETASQVDERLASLQGEYDALDKKYQKLLRPARSSKNKQIVEVVYQRSGYRLKPPGGKAQTLSKSALERELTALKAQYGNDLYVKIIIPENSGLSYNEAWAFTRDTLNQYDYYYQNDIEVIEEATEEAGTTE